MVYGRQNQGVRRHSVNMVRMPSQYLDAHHVAWFLWNISIKFVLIHRYKSIFAVVYFFGSRDVLKVSKMTS